MEAEDAKQRKVYSNFQLQLDESPMFDCPASSANLCVDHGKAKQRLVGTGASVRAQPIPVGGIHELSNSIEFVKPHEGRKLVYPAAQTDLHCET